MNINERESDGVVILSLSGELMGDESSEFFQKYVYKLIEENKVNVVLDMQNVKWMNSAGLGMLMGVLTTLRSSGGDLRLASLSERVQRPIELTRLDSVINVFDSVDSAVNSFTEEE